MTPCIQPTAFLNTKMAARASRLRPAVQLLLLCTLGLGCGGVHPEGVDTAPGGEDMGGGVPTGVTTSDVPLAVTLQMPVGREPAADLSRLSVGVFEAIAYPKIRFNDDLDSVADGNEWYVATAFDENRWLSGGWAGTAAGPYNDFNQNGKPDFHPGEDWNRTDGSDTGETVTAIADGVVIYNGCAYGNTVVLLHRISTPAFPAGEVVASFYGHLKDDPGLVAGTPVSRGLPIGTVGRTNRDLESGACIDTPDMGPHLHFEVRRQSLLSIDPLTAEIRLRFTNVNGDPTMWPASLPSNVNDDGQLFIRDNYYPPAEFLTGELPSTSQPCTFSVLPSAATFGPGGGTAAIEVTVADGCEWDATSAAGWMTVLSGTPASGSGAVTFSVSANASQSSRTGTLQVAGQTVSVHQSGLAPCSYSVSPASSAFGSAGGSGSIAIATDTGCTWNATSSASWISILSASGSGSGTVGYSVAANGSSDTRYGSILVAGQTINVVQSGISCAYAINPGAATIGASGGSGTIGIVTSSACPWTAASGVSWISLGSTSGSGPGTLTYTVLPNTGAAPRSGTMTIAGLTFTVTQSGTTPSERLVNGSFSSGAAGWTLTGDFWAGTNLLNYRTGPGYAAGGVGADGASKNNAYGSAYQDVTIPASATTAMLSFWSNVTSSDSPTVPYDVLNVTLRTPSGGYLATVATRSNLHQSTVGSYTQSTFDLIPYKGQTVRIHFLATSDVTLPTVFRLDDVSVVSDGY